MKYLGLDYGTKRIGVAVSDDAGGFAFPRETIPNDVSAIDRISRLVKDDKVSAIVMGDTRAVNGVENDITQKADIFAGDVERHVGVPVHRVMEAWSSVEAARFAPKGKEHDDAAAAAVLLQRYLDGLRSTESEEML